MLQNVVRTRELLRVAIRTVTIIIATVRFDLLIIATTFEILNRTVAIIIATVRIATSVLRPVPIILSELYVLNFKTYSCDNYRNCT